VYSPTGEIEATLEGKWDEGLARKLSPNHLQVLWRATPFPKNTLDFYGFTAWGITLNEVTPDLKDKLPATDSRNRPDVRALEEGNLDGAEAEKERLEELQRERRRQGRIASLSGLGTRAMNGFMQEDTGSNGPRAGKPRNRYGDADHPRTLFVISTGTSSLISFDECPWQVKGLTEPVHA
jgi:hypothetical protein